MSYEGQEIQPEEVNLTLAYVETLAGGDVARAFGILSIACIVAGYRTGADAPEIAETFDEYVDDFEPSIIVDENPIAGRA